MTEIREHEGYGLRYNLPALLLVVSVFVVPVAAVIYVIVSPSGLCCSLAFIQLFPILVVTRIWRHRLLTRLRCQECGRMLKFPKSKSELEIHDPLNFTCPDCDITWDTGCHWGGGGTLYMKTPDDDEGEE